MRNSVSVFPGEIFNVFGIRHRYFLSPVIVCCFLHALGQDCERLVSPGRHARRRLGSCYAMLAEGMFKAKARRARWLADGPILSYLSLSR